MKSNKIFRIAGIGDISENNALLMRIIEVKMCGKPISIEDMKAGDIAEALTDSVGQKPASYTIERVV